MSGVVPRTREVVAVGSRYKMAVVCGIVATDATIAALSGSSHSGDNDDREVQLLEGLRQIISSTNKITITVAVTRTNVMLNRLSGGPDGKEGLVDSDPSSTISPSLHTCGLSSAGLSSRAQLILPSQKYSLLTQCVPKLQAL